MSALITGLLIPFAGTSAGAACVFFMKGAMRRGVLKGAVGRSVRFLFSIDATRASFAPWI